MPSTRNTVPAPLSYIRFFQTFPTQRLLTLLIDNKVYHKKWSYEDFTQYFKITSGQHLIQIKDTVSSELLFERHINVKPISAYTYLLAEHPKKDAILHLFNIEDIRKSLKSPHAYLRLAQFSKCVTPSFILSSSEQNLFKNIQYAQSSHYIPLDCLNYDFLLKETAEDKILLDLKKVPIKVGRLYTFYTIGNNSETYPLKIVISIDGPSYLKFKTPESDFL